jgi:RimJ/RimL family protein N-acetyltransferase
LNVGMLPRVAESVTLRRLAPLDLLSFQRYRHDALVARYQGWSPQSDADAAAFIAEMQHATMLEPGIWCQIGIALSASNDLIGDIGICVSASASEAEIGFTLSREAQGRGLATQAVREAIAMIFQHSGVPTIVGITDARNVASIKLMQRLGMSQSEIRETNFKGQPCTEYTFILRK